MASRPVPHPPLELAEHISLLWPAGQRPASEAADQLADSAAEDLNLSVLLEAMVEVGGPPVRVQRRQRYARQVLGQLVTRADVIVYRQEVLEDLLSDPELRNRLVEVLPALEAVAEITTPLERYRASDREAIDRVVRRLADLELFVDVARQLTVALAVDSVRSTALRGLRDELDRLVGSEVFQGLEAELPTLRATLASVRSLTIGVNLGADLQPESATILEFGTERIDGRRGLIGRLFGASGLEGLTPLQRGDSALMGGQNELVRDLSRLVQRAIGPVAAALARYAAVSGRALGRLGPELGFVLGGARLVERLEAAGLPTCRPQILLIEQRSSDLDDAYDPGLALRQLVQTSSPGIVSNAVILDGKTARVWVLSGPNRSGKTTYVRAVGLAHVLGQAGLRVTARGARLSPVDTIYTHFPMLEPDQPGQGRLDMEAARVAAIFQRATPNSLILLNEALAGTSAFEALDLARGIVRGLRLLGARSIYVTHLHELAAAVDEINAATPGDARVGSLVAEPGAHQRVPANSSTQRGRLTRTFRITAGKPHGLSFAAEIAEDHGISFPRLVNLLKQRGLLPP